MKTMITRNNVPRHNGTMRCLLGRNGLQEFRVITPRHGLLLCSSEQEPVEASGSCGSRREAVEDVGKRVEDREGVGRGAGGAGGAGGTGRGPEEVQKAVGKCGRGGKAQEVTVW